MRRYLLPFCLLCLIVVGCIPQPSRVPTEVKSASELEAAPSAEASAQ